VVGVAAALFAGSLGVAASLGGEFIPRLDEGAVALQVWRLPSVSIEEAAQQSTMLEKVLLRDFKQEIVTVVSKTGRPEIATDPMGVEMSDVFVGALDARHRAGDLLGPAAELVEVLAVELDGDVRSNAGDQLAHPQLDRTDVKVEQVSGLPILTVHAPGADDGLRRCARLPPDGDLVGRRRRGPTALGHGGDWRPLHRKRRSLLRGEIGHIVDVMFIMRRRHVEPT
jgi:hypothetical protein